MSSERPCDICKRPRWDGGHALNERECSQANGEVCRLHARLAEYKEGLAVANSNVRVAKQLIDDQRRLMSTLFAAIKHGDEKHQEWLKNAIDSHFAGVSKKA